MASIFENTPVNNVKEPMTKDSITLVAGKPNEDQYQITDNLCKDLLECGFNALAAHINFDPNQPEQWQIKQSQ